MIKPYFIYEITSLCNNKCLYCYNVWKEKEDYPQGELTFAQISGLFDKVIAEARPWGITLTGGEPLIHPDILALAAYFKQKKIRLGLATNGVLLTDTLTRKLVHNGVSYFEVSLPAASIKTYSHLCQSDGMGQARQAILNIKKYRAQLTVSFVITKVNLASIEDVIDLCFAFSVDTLALNRFVPGGNGLKYLKELEITEEELREILAIADKKSAEYNFPINITVPIESCIIEHQSFPYLNFGSCACGRDKWVIDSLGNLRTCEQNPEILGSLFKKSFYELVNSEEVKSFQENNLKTECINCAQYNYCGGGCRLLRSSPAVYQQ